MRRLIDQSCTRPVPPSTRTGASGLPLSSRSASTWVASARASAIVSSPVTCTTWTSLQRRQLAPQQRVGAWLDGIDDLQHGRRDLPALRHELLGVGRRAEQEGRDRRRHAAGEPAAVARSMMPVPLGIGPTRPSASAP